MTIYDKSGFNPLHYSAYKNTDRAVEILINFALSEEADRDYQRNANGGSGETDDLK